MPTDRDTPAPELGPGRAHPELTEGAASVLLRILRKAHETHLAAKAGSPDVRDERDVA
jgi:hypothetical protein